MIRLIAAIDSRRGLARQGALPWHIPEDIRYFQEQTRSRGGNVLLGRATYQTFKQGPLNGRQTYVLTRDTAPIPGVTLVHDLNAFLDEFKDKDLWVAGGAQVFAEIIQAGRADELWLTHVDGDFRCDQFFPPYRDTFKLVDESEPHEQNGLSFRYARYLREE